MDKMVSSKMRNRPAQSRIPVYVFLGVLAIAFCWVGVAEYMKVQAVTRGQRPVYSATLMRRDGQTVTMQIRSSSQQGAQILANRIQNWMDTSTVIPVEGQTIPMAVLSPTPLHIPPLTTTQ